ncbi:FAD-dependent oxidoreductase [Domibacillus indicus]|uniref:FAD-dependent oxidoreductase n=1 Tax=Domibacillus indicus TaxID=1437523 RepID=UPI000A6496F6|nr:FAD-dependent oxidoreductase [Domibacillus indicus]
MIFLHTLIIGGGFGGLTAAALLAKTGHDVTLVEASSEWGGCAGKFRRRDTLFPVGATLGMGFERGGLHERVLRLLGKKVPVRLLDEVMTIHFPSGSIPYYRDREKHLASLCDCFPHAASRIRAFYSELRAIAASIRRLMKPLPALPPKTAGEWAYLFSSLRPEHIKLAPFGRKTLMDRLCAHGLEKETAFVRLLDGQLIDSMQTTSRHVSYLMAATALDIYHEGAYYVEGGLYRAAEVLAESIRENGGAVKKNRRIVSIKRNSGWTAVDQRGNEYHAEHIIFNGAIQQLPSLTPELSGKHRVMAGTPTWVTHTLYLTLNNADLPLSFPLFQQISADSMSEGSHLFMSVSAPDDRLRAPEGKRTMTVSTHSSPDCWSSKKQYDAYKPALTEKMLSLIETVYPNFRKAILAAETGAPKAWERYTLRPGGFVGGFPQTAGHALFGSLSHRTGLPNLWVCGDSIFPGGGTIGATASGIHCARSIAPGLFEL